MVKINLTNNQTAFEYAFYMIASSYFDKAICESKILEKKMLIQYKEQKLKKQYQMENICIAYMDRLAKSLPNDFFRQNMKVFLVKKTANNLTEIVFKNEKTIIKFVAIYKGRNSLIRIVGGTKKCTM